MLFLLGILLIAGVICGLVGWIWTVVIAFMNEEYGWGIASLICGIAALVYAGMDMSERKIPLILMGISVISNIVGRAVLMSLEA